MTDRTDRTDVGTVEELHAAATKLVGLDDFGSNDDNYLEALEVLLDSYRRDAGLTPLGSKMNRFFVRGALVARLLSESSWKQYPQHADVAIEQPIFVTGLPRTGTTALHRLLGADPTHQGLHLWLAEFPQPRPPREAWDENPFYRQLDAQFTQAHKENPDYTGLHFMAAYEFEECWQLLRQSLHSVSYETLSAPAQLLAMAVAAGLDAVISAAPQEPSTDRTQRRRQALGAQEPQPSFRAGRVDGDLSRRAGDPDPPAGRNHHGLDVLVGAAHRRRAGRRRSPAPQIGADAMETWSRGLERFDTARAKYDSAQFYDVDYHDLIADPLGTVAEIYRQFGLTLTDDARQAMADIHAESQTGARAPKHTYSLADYGLTTEWSRSGSPDCDGSDGVGVVQASGLQVVQVPLGDRMLDAVTQLRA